MVRFWPPVLALLLLLPAVAAVGLAADDMDLSGPIPAGEFRAWRIRLDAPGEVEVGATTGGLDTGQPVLPVLTAAVKNGVPFDASAIYVYDNQASLTAVVRAAGQDQRVGSHHVQGGGWTTYTLQPAEYLFVVATGPGDGSFDGILRIHTTATILATEAGPALWARGLDASDTAIDAFGYGQGYVRHWQYSGHDFAAQVNGQLFGYIGYHQGAAHWVDPNGNVINGFALGGPGAWTASFPQEFFAGPVCGFGCVPGLGDSREDPPFAIGADVTI